MTFSAPLLGYANDCSLISLLRRTGLAHGGGQTRVLAVAVQRRL